METHTQGLIRQLTRFGLRLDSKRHTNGKFCVLEIGTGADYDTLEAFRKELVRLFDCANLIRVTQVDNREHPDFGKFFVEINPFYWEEPTA